MTHPDSDAAGEGIEAVSQRPSGIKRLLIYTAFGLGLVLVVGRWFGVGDGLSIVSTVTLFGAGLLLWAANPIFSRSLKPFVIWYGLFLIWAWASLLWTDLTVFAIQNLFLLSSFYCFVLYFSTPAPGLWRELSRAIRTVSVLAILIFVGRLVFFGVPEGGTPLFRPFALFLTVLLAWISASAGLASRRTTIYDWLLSLTILGTIGATGSRTAMAIGVSLCVLAFSFSCDGRLRLIRLGAGAAFGGLLLAMLMTNVPRFAERPGTDTVDVASAEVNVSGRLNRWVATLDSWNENSESSLIGKGAGSVARPLQPWPGPHPLNDYLRLLHDYGAIGLGLWMMAMLGILIPVLTGSLRRPQREPVDDPLSRLVVLNCMTVLSAACLFLIPLVYFFVMIPLAVMIGAASSPDAGDYEGR